MAAPDNHFPFVNPDPDLPAFPQLPVRFRQRRNYAAKGAEMFHVAVQITVGKPGSTVKPQACRRRRLAGIGQQLGLVTFELPLAVPDFPYLMAWHMRTNSDPALTWLREVVAEEILASVSA